VKPSQLRKLLLAAIPAREPVFVVSQPGVGKTSIYKQVAEELGYDLVLSHPAVEDATDPKGIPWGNPAGEIDFRPVGQVKKVLAATRPTLWVFDDFGQGAPAVQAGYMQWLLGRECAGHKLPDCVSMGAASNRRTDRAGVSGVLEPVKSRFTTIVELEADVNEWTTWAFANGVEPELVAFLRFRSDLLAAFQPTADLTNSPTPRTWANASRILTLGMPADVEAAAVKGAVGEGAAVEFLAFRKMYRSLPSIDGILIDPNGADIPKDMSVLCAVTTALGQRATPANFGRIARYAERLHKEAELGEFAALLVLDSQRKDPQVCNTTDYIRLVSGDLQALITGDVR
jgi:hypothetical protein